MAHAGAIEPAATIRCGTAALRCASGVAGEWQFVEFGMVCVVSGPRGRSVQLVDGWGVVLWDFAGALPLLSPGRTGDLVHWSSASGHSLWAFDFDGADGATKFWTLVRSGGQCV